MNAPIVNNIIQELDPDKIRCDHCAAMNSLNELSSMIKKERVNDRYSYS